MTPVAENTPGSEANPYLSPRWALAEQVAAAACRRHPADIVAIGVRGSLAHGDDSRTDDVELIVVTYRPGTGPPSAIRRVGGVLVELTVAAGDEHLQQARLLTPSWPLVADRYVTTKAIDDPRGWLVKLRDAHLGRLADAKHAEFTGLARQSWYRAASAHARAVKLAEWYDTDAALLLLGEARLAAAMVVGLLSRTYFRNSADAVTRTGMAGADMTELATVLKEQAAELANRGRPVDGPVDALFSVNG